MLSLYNLSIEIPSSIEENKLLCIKPLGRIEKKLKTRYDLILTIIPDFPYFTQSLFWSLFWVHLAISHICPFSLSICPFQCCHLVGLLNCLEDAEKSSLLKPRTIDFTEILSCQGHSINVSGCSYFCPNLIISCKMWNHYSAKRYWQPENISDK